MDKFIEFYNPTTGFEMDDFQIRVMEVIMEVFSNPEEIDSLILDLMAQTNELNSEEQKAFVKVVGGLRCIRKLIANNKETFHLFLIEREQYKSKRKCIEM